MARRSLVLVTEPVGGLRDPQRLLVLGTCGSRPPLAWRLQSGVWIPQPPGPGSCYPEQQAFGPALALIWSNEVLLPGIDRLARVLGGPRPRASTGHVLAWLRARQDQIAGDLLTLDAAHKEMTLPNTSKWAMRRQNTSENPCSQSS